MTNIMHRPSAILAFGWFVLFMGMNSAVDISAMEFLPERKASTTPHPKTKFIMELRITNRIYNDSLNDQESEEYKWLKQEVDYLFSDVYGPTSLEYLGTDQMTFRNGSVIVSAQLLFGTTIMDPVLGRSLFFSTYKQLPSPILEIDLDHVASVNSVDMFMVETSTETTVVPTPYPKTKFYMEIRIINRIYTPVLKNEKSDEYATLRGEVDQLFFDVYNPTPLEYITTDQITFRNGSIIVGAELLFGTIMINPTLERNLFLRRYIELKDPVLDIDIQFVQDILPTQQPVDPPTTASPHISTTHLTSTSHTTTHSTLPTSHSTSTHSPTQTTTLMSTTVQSTTRIFNSTTSLSPTLTPSNTTMHPNNQTNQSPTPHNSINTTTPHNSINTTTPQNSINTTTPHDGINTTIPHNSINTTTPQNSINTTTPHNSINITTPHNSINTTTPHNSINITIPHNSINTTTPHNRINTTTPHNSINTTTPHNSINTTTLHNSINTTTPNSSINTTTLHSSINTTTPHNSSNTTTPPHNSINTTTPINSTITPTSHNKINSTTSHNGTSTTMPSNATITLPIHNVTHITSTVSSRPTDSPTTAGALVPGWGIALLVLAAICLLLLIILLIILLVMCCCWPNKRTAPHPEVITPPMYFNPDIPMYSTHSTVDSPNVKHVDIREKPPKNRTGMYMVNK